MPSVIDDVVRDAADAIAREHHVDMEVNPPNPHESECVADYEEHRAAITQLLRLAAELATPPRSLHLVIYPETPPITRLYIRGAGIPTMYDAISEEHRPGVRAAAAAIKQISARLLRDPGGFLVLYGTFAADDP